MVNEEEKIRLIHEYRSALLDRMFDELSRKAPDDVYTLRACWEEFERRGLGQPVLFFRPCPSPKLCETINLVE